MCEWAKGEPGNLEDKSIEIIQSTEWERKLLKVLEGVELDVLEDGEKMKEVKL